MVSGEGFRSGSAGNGIHHRRLDLDKVSLVEVTTHVGHHLGTGDEDVTSSIVHDQIEIALTISLFLVLEAVIFPGQLMQAWRQENDLSSEDGELSLRTVSRSCPSRVADHTDDISSPEMLVLCFERNLTSGLLGLTHYLNLDSLGADVVEHELGSRRTFGVYPTSQPDFHLRQLLAGLDRLILLEELSKVGVDLKLMGIREWIFRLAKFVDMTGANLKVLLRRWPWSVIINHLEDTLSI